MNNNEKTEDAINLVDNNTSFKKLGASDKKNLSGVGVCFRLFDLCPVERGCTGAWFGDPPVCDINQRVMDMCKEDLEKCIAAHSHSKR